jgi:diaminopimelate decarboxylase
MHTEVRNDIFSISPSGQRGGLAALPAKVHPLIQGVLKETRLLTELTRAYGSPLNIVLPELVVKNVVSFRETFEHYNLQGRIFFTSKPNRSAAILREVATCSELGVDVSSAGSLKAALSAGVPAARIEATGPKNLEYLTLCVQHGVLLNVDSLSELSTLTLLHSQLELSSPISVVVRLSGFGGEGSSFSVGDGTFGVSLTNLSTTLDFLREHRKKITLLGFSFHLNTSSTEFKAAAAQEGITAILQARERGLKPNVLNIGGGFRISYAQRSEDWREFILALRNSLLSKGPAVTWNRTGLGLRLEKERVSGSFKGVEHYSDLPPADQLCALLNFPLSRFGELGLAQVLDELGISLHIEPGRALLEQVGITIGRVAFLKESEQGELLVGLEMNRSNLNTNELTLLTDPVLIGASSDNNPVGAYLMGNLCVANELVNPRKVVLPRKPVAGDLLAFINTAAYSMDFNESPTLYQKVAEKVALRWGSDGFIWYQDQNYLPKKLEVGEREI